MIGPILVDSGPIVALLNRREQHHAWAFEQFKLIRPPALTCEAVISECSFLLRSIDDGVDALMELQSRGVLSTPFTLTSELPAISKLLKRYRSMPMSLADASLVRMAEQFSRSKVLSLDGDFRIYRKNGRQVIPTLMPE